MDLLMRMTGSRQRWAACWDGGSGYRRAVETREGAHPHPWEEGRPPTHPACSLRYVKSRARPYAITDADAPLVRGC